MTRQHRWSLLACALGALDLPQHVAAQVTPFGAELQVNSYTTGYQKDPAAAVDADGDYVVVWESLQDGTDSGIFGQRFSSTGQALATEFKVNDHTIGPQVSPAVAASPGGDFVVTWDGSGQDLGSFGVIGRRFSSAGLALGDEFGVNSYTPGAQFESAVAAHAEGFVVAWQSKDQDGASYGVFGRRFSSAGEPLAAEMQINAFTDGAQDYPAVAADADGDFVVVWRSFGQDGSANGVFARRYSSAGQALAAEFQANSYTGGNQNYPAVAAAAAGGFVVAWTSYLQDGAVGGIFARRFTSTGQAFAPEFQVNTYTTYNQASVSVAADPDGDFVVAWQSFGQDGSVAGVFARRFSSAGIAEAPEFPVNTYSAGNQTDPSVTAAGNGFVVAWMSFGQDGSEEGVFAQRFTVPAPYDVDGNGTSEALTDGLLALRYLFGFRGAVLVTGAVGAGCTRCDAPAIEAYLAGMV